MTYLKQFGIILLFSLIGEGIHAIVPLPIPASIYGIVLLFTALMCGIVKLDDVDKAGSFLIEIMPVMFIPAAVGLIESRDILGSRAVVYLVVMAVSTVVVMAAAGRATQAVIRRTGGKQK